VLLIARTVYSWKSKEHRRQIRMTGQDAFDEDLVVIISPTNWHAVPSIGVERFSQGSIFRERNRVGRSGRLLPKTIVVAINVGAAQGDNSSNAAAEYLQYVSRVLFGVWNEINDDFWSETLDDWQ
jgi:hypothetical protein